MIHIKYVKQKDIDKTKWDHCVATAENGLIYAHAFYLDAISKHWDALILNDYEAVMPLTWNRKFGFYYLYQPYFTGSFGIIGNTSDELINLFLKLIPQHFKYIDIDFIENNINPETIALKNLQLKKRNNFLLDLNKSYDQIKSGYKRLALRMLKKAAHNEIEIVKNVDPIEVIDFYKKNYQSEHKYITTADYERLLAATRIALKKEMAATYLAKIDGTVVASYLVLKDGKFIYSLLGGSNGTGKNAGAFYLLTDTAIQDHAAMTAHFRFEGSDKKGIAFFNSQFNPVAIHYYHLRLNKLPWPVNLLK